MATTLPQCMGDNILGHIFWASIFCYFVIFPLALNRKISALRHASYFSFFCGTYVVLVIVFTCLVNRKVNPDLKNSLKTAATTMNFSASGIFNSFPLIVFSFMYQPNLPAVYQELKTKTMPSMWKIVMYATTIAVICYILAGYFGFATFSCYNDVDEIMELENIFAAPY